MKSIRIILTALFLVAIVSCQAQFRPLLPRTLPSPNSKNYYKIGYVQPDSGILLTSRDTLWKPKFPAVVYWKNTGVDSSLWLYNMIKWVKVGTGSGGGIGSVIWSLGFPTYDARYSLLGHTHNFNTLTGRPTTLSGYGITDASPLSHSHTLDAILQFNSVSGQTITTNNSTVTDATLYNNAGRVRTVHTIGSGGGITAELYNAGIGAWNPGTLTLNPSGIVVLPKLLASGAGVQIFPPTGSITKGSLLYYDLDNGVLKHLPIGLNGQTLQTNPSGLPVWANILGAVDTTFGPNGVTTRYRVKTLIDSALANNGLGFVADEGLIGVVGLGTDPDTVIVEDLGITTQKLADDAVVTSKITNLHVTTPKIGNLAVTNGKIADGAVDDNKMATNQKIGSLPSLTTTDKSSVVAAINEVKAGLGGGGGGTSYRDLLKDTVITNATAWTFFLGGYISTYKTIEIKITSLAAAVSTDQLYMQLSSNGGSSYDNAVNAYRYTIQATLTGGNENTDNVFIMLAGNFTNAAGDVTDLVVRIPHPNVATSKPTVFWNGYHPTATVVTSRLAVETLVGSARRDNAQITNAVRIFSNGGNMSCNIQIYGEK